MPRQHLGTDPLQPESTRRCSWFDDRRPGFGGGPLAGGGLPLNFLLKLDQSVEDHLGTRRAPRDVDIHRQDRVNAHHGGVVVVEPAGASTDSEGHYPLGLGHLIIDAPQDRGDFVTDRSNYKKHISLARRESRQARAETVHIVMRAGGCHILHAAARRHERILEDREFSRPADGLLQAAGKERWLADRKKHTSELQSHSFISYAV